MGRQIAIILDQPDEAALFAFLRETAEISVYQSRSPHAGPVETMWPGPQNGVFWIHNQSFKWSPRFQRIDFVDKSTGQPQTYFALDTLHAPVVEYVRHMRLYWAKLFVSQPEDLEYDMAQFDKWFSHICRWIRRNGQKLSLERGDVWCLPAAFARLRADA